MIIRRCFSTVCVVVLCLFFMIPRSYGEGLARFTLNGYADASIAVRKSSSTFSIGDFSPLLQFGYGNNILFQGNPIFELQDDSTTKVDLNIFTFNFVLSDHLVLILGKFPSPIGVFREHLRPTWINKLPVQPVGYSDSRSVAPLHNIGAQLKGAHYLCCKPFKLMYSVFVSNGPNLVNQLGQVLVSSEEKNRLNKESKMAGGRITLGPIPELDLSISGAYSKIGLGSEENRDYVLSGLDFVYHGISSYLSDFEFRGEFVRSYVQLPGSGTRKEKAWYLQASYKIGSTDFVPVVRYGQLWSETFNAIQSGTASQNSEAPPTSEKQAEYGVSYEVHPNIWVKLAMIEHTIMGVASHAQWISQVAFGF